MVKKIIQLLLRKRHYWRTVSFDELSELYTSSLIRSLANSLIGIFVPIFLFKSGVSLHDIFAFYAFWFVIRPPINVLNAYLIGRVGPKHSLAFASFGYIAFLALLLSFQNLHWPLWLLAIFGSWSMGLYLVAFHTDFSKVKHPEHGGKELSYLTVLERIGGVAGPLIGGLIATYYDPKLTIAAAILLQLVALVPLFMTKEPVRTKQHIQFRGMAWRRHKADFISTIPLVVENFISVIIWPLFLAASVLATAVYAKIGIIVAAGTLVAIVAARLIGSMIDESKGGLLLRVGATLNAVLHLFRPFVGNFLQAIGLNVLNDPVTVAYQMPYMKGFYDAADSLPGYRIAYISVMQTAGDIAKTLLCTAMWLFSVSINPVVVMQAAFFVAAICSIAIMSERYPALRSKL